MRGLQVVLEWAAGTLLFLLLVVGFLQVMSRYTGLIFLPWTEEVARLLFVWVVWVGAAAGLLRGSHIRFDYVVDRLPAPVRRAMEFAVSIGVGLFLIVVVRYGYEVAQSQASSTFLTFNLSVKYTYLSAVLGSALMLVGLAAGVWTRMREPAAAPGDRP
ncbi:MAG TPA: TRAP transporter small permease [Candidatus Methylomirabilis sp.]|nr:TRAP transporter small permease [Candidatus Methylomirabilis sp.]